MWIRPVVKIAMVAALVAAALAGRPESPPWLTLGVVVFGACNVWLDRPGTAWIRALAVAGTFAVLARPDLLFGPVALAAWLLWVPAFAVAWAAGRPDGNPAEGTAARYALATI